MHALHHVCLLSHMAENAPGGLILVDECQFRSRLIEQDLLDHPVGPPRIDHGSIQRRHPHKHHDWQHDRVGSIERVLLDENRQKS